MKNFHCFHRLQVENENLRELLEISGRKLPPAKSEYLDHVCAVSPNSNHEKLDFNEEIKSSPRSRKYLKPEAQQQQQRNTTRDDHLSSATSDGKNNSSDGMSEEELFNSLPSNKRYGGKKGQRVPLMFNDENDDTDNDRDKPTSGEESKNAKNKKHITNLENLFKDPSEALNEDSMLMDPSESCFRAIISDIKPLDFTTMDMNEKLSEKLFENVNTTSTTSTTTNVISKDKPQHHTSSPTNPFLPEIQAAAAAGLLSGGNVSVLDTNINETSVLDFLDSVVDASARGDASSDPLFSSGATEKAEENGFSAEEQEMLAKMAGGSSSMKKMAEFLSSAGPPESSNVPLSDLFKNTATDEGDSKTTHETENTGVNGQNVNDDAFSDDVTDAFTDVDKAFTDTSLDDLGK